MPEQTADRLRSDVPGQQPRCKRVPQRVRRPRDPTEHVGKLRTKVSSHRLSERVRIGESPVSRLYELYLTAALRYSILMRYRR